MEGFSGALKLTGLDDFITPSQACVKPIEGPQKKQNSGTARVVLDAEGGYSELLESGERQPLGNKAKITLQDCLACSGCITSAEAVLVSAQSGEEFWRQLESVRTGQRVLVVSISPQARASLGARFGLDALDTHRRLVRLFQDWGARLVTDTTASRDITLAEMTAEFVARYRRAQAAAQATQAGTNGGAEAEAEGDAGPLPMLCSACPGWICYVEKTHAELLPHLSRVRSPQQVMGALVKRVLTREGGPLQGLRGEQILHVTLMPCFDKKLEAAREDFRDGSPDVDLVLTPLELLQMLEERGILLTALPPAPLDPHTCPLTNLDRLARERAGDADADANAEVLGFAGTPGSSGGYAEAVLRGAARELFGHAGKEAAARVELRAVGRNADLREARLEVPGGAAPPLVVATCYGFRNIQNLVRRIRQQRCEYAFVEVMACPGGCLNGGGQLRPEPPESARDLLARVDRVYHAHLRPAPPLTACAQLAAIYHELLAGGPRVRDAFFRTRYHAREKLPSNRLAIQW